MDTLIHVYRMWLAKCNLQSMVKPGNFSAVQWGKETFEIFKEGRTSGRVLYQKIIWKVLLMFIDSLFANVHLWNVLISALHLLARCSKTVYLQMNVVSSANVIGITSLIVLDKSLIYNMNSNGPKIESWGTPTDTGFWSKSSFFVLTIWTLFHKQLDFNFKATPRTPYLSSSHKRVWWTIVLNSIDKSINTTNGYCFLLSSS